MSPRRGGSDSTVTRTCRATGEALLVPARNRREKVGRITGETGKSAEAEGGAAGSAVGMRRRKVAGAKGPAICNVSNIGEGKDEMTKASIDLQDLRRRIYVKAKAEPSWRFWGLYVRMLRSDRASAGNDGVGRAESHPSRIGLISLDMKQMGERSAGNPHAAFDVAGAGNVARSRYLGRSRRASPRPYRRGGGWRRGMVKRACRRASPRSPLPPRALARGGEGSGVGGLSAWFSAREGADGTH